MSWRFKARISFANALRIHLYERRVDSANSGKLSSPSSRIHAIISMTCSRPCAAMIPNSAKFHLMALRIVVRWRVMRSQARYRKRTLCCSSNHVWNKKHGRSPKSPTNHLAICSIILLPFDVGFHLGQWNKSHFTAKSRDLPRPVVRSCASFQSD